jgi:HAD superfamily hydrolase (TIGR01549 family)
MPLRVVLFDLFGTVVHFASAVPTVSVGGEARRPTMQWLQEGAKRELPSVAFEDLRTSLKEVTEEIIRERPPAYREVASEERFRRAIERVGVPAKEAGERARRLARIHMRYLASLTVLPPAYDALLRRLAKRYRLGLVSNFDHAATAHGILRDHGIADVFDTTLISEEFGHRKPNPAIFREALSRLNASPGEAIFVGDSLFDDVEGARAADLRVVWVNGRGDELPPDAPIPDHVIGELSALPSIVDRA